MNRYLTLIYFLLSVFLVYPKSPSAVTTAKIDSLLKLSHKSYINIEILSSMEYAIEAKSISDQHNYSEGIARSSFYIAQVLSSIGDYNQSLEYLSLAENERYTQRDPHFYSEVSRIQGRVLGMLGLNESAVRVFKRGLSQIDRLKESSDKAYFKSMAFENLSSIYSILNIPDSTFHYLDLNRSLLTDLDEGFIYRNLINLYGQYGKEFINIEQYDSASYYLDQAFILADKYKFPYTSYIYHRRGELEAKQGNYQTALDNYYAALQNLDETGIKQGANLLYQSISDIYIQTGLTDSAHYYLTKKNEFERELSSTNTTALDNAVHTMLEEERSRSRSEYNRVLTTVIIITALIVLIGISVFMIWKKNNKKNIEENKSKIEDLEFKLSDAAAEVIKLAKNNDDSFIMRFNELYPDYIRDIYAKHPNLTNTEYFFTVLIYLNFSSKEIAQILNIEHRSVQTRKGRLRKKLGITPNTDLYHYLKTLGDSPVV